MTLAINFDRLLKLRLIVARFGEMDLAKWWNTRGQLGRLGTGAVRRGFPRTHYFAQARSVFAVAAHRCSEIFDRPDSLTLWRLPETIEEEFAACWERWLDQANQWQPFFRKLEGLQESDLRTALHAFDAITDRESELLTRLRRSAEGRAVPLPEPFSGTDQDVALLALDLREEKLVPRCALRTPGRTHESVSPFPRGLVIHSHKGGDDQRDICCV